MNFTDCIKQMRSVPQTIYKSKGLLSAGVGLHILQLLYNQVSAFIDQGMSNAGLMDYYELKQIKTECDNTYNGAKTELELFKAVMEGKNGKMNNTQINHNETIYNGPVVQGGDYVNGDKIIHNHPETPAQSAAAIPILTDKECIEKLDSTGFIMLNPQIKDKTIYTVKKGHTVLDVFDEAARITGSEKRARLILIQNMSGVEATLNTHRPKHSLKS